MTPEKVISDEEWCGYLALFDPCLVVGVAGALSRFCIQFAPCALKSRRRFIAPSKDSPGYFSPLNRRQVAPDTLMLVRLWISSLDIPESVLWPHIKLIKWLKANDSRSFPAGVRRFESGPSHYPSFNYIHYQVSE